MAIDDAAGRRAVRERRRPTAKTESVFVQQPRHSTRTPALRLALREDVHQRGLDAAKKALRSHIATKATAKQ
jgi:hypothetical protein